MELSKLLCRFYKIK